MDIKIRKSKKARRLKIVVNPGGEVIVVKPWFVSLRSANAFLRNKKDWIIKSIEKQKKIKSSLIASSREDYLKNKDKARVFIGRRLEHFSSIYGFEPRSFSVRNQKTRWGSCSSRGNLNFNWQIIKLPQYLADYIIVHELCHLRELNHSERFWKLVSKTTPRYKKIRKEIKEKGMNLL